MIKDRTAANPPSTSSRSRWFLGCFGGSGVTTTMQPSTEEEEVNSSSGRRRKSVFKWKSSFGKSAAKTVVVPVELTAVGSRKSTKSFPAKSNTTWEIQVVEEDKGRIYVEPRFATEEDATLTKKQNSRRKKWIDIVKRQNGSSNRSRKETKPAAVAPPKPPELHSPGKKSVTISDDAIPIVVPPLKHLTRSTSISPPHPAKGKKLPRDPPPAGGGVRDGGSNKTTTFGGGGFDSIIGMSIILVTLVIMMLWGKLCAILCTSAWFFIAPRLVAVGGHSAVATAEKRVAELVSVNNKVDLESVEYKKKVVLEGLLQRNHRNIGVGRL